MQDRLEERLKELKAEFEKGQKALAQLEAQRKNIQESMLRISGAIRVLEEEIDRSRREAEGGDPQWETRQKHSAG